MASLFSVLPMKLLAPDMSIGCGRWRGEKKGRESEMQKSPLSFQEGRRCQATWRARSRTAFSLSLFLSLCDLTCSCFNKWSGTTRQLELNYSRSVRGSIFFWEKRFPLNFKGKELEEMRGEGKRDRLEQLWVQVNDGEKQSEKKEPDSRLVYFTCV